MVFPLPEVGNTGRVEEVGEEKRGENEYDLKVLCMKCFEASKRGCQVSEVHMEDS